MHTVSTVDYHIAGCNLKINIVGYVGLTSLVGLFYILLSKVKICDVQHTKLMHYLFYIISINVPSAHFPTKGMQH